MKGLRRHGGMVMGIARAPRRAAAVAAAGCGGMTLAVLVAACASGTNSPGAASSSVTPGGPASAVSPSPQSSTQASSSPASPPPAKAKPQCATPDLVAKAASMPGNAAAGSTYVPVDFTNISAHTCVMFGYPGVSWVTGMRGSQIGDAAARVTGYPSVTVTLAPNGAAHAWLQIADAGNFPASTCHPVTAHWLRIYPPDQYTSLYAKFTSQACSGKITGGGKPLQVMPVRADNAVSGQVP